MEAAYGKSTYEEAKAALKALKPELRLMNQSAHNSLEDGFDETLTLHRLGLMPMLKSFRTTNDATHKHAKVNEYGSRQRCSQRRAALTVAGTRRR